MNICHVNLASAFGGGERQTLVLIEQQLKMGYQLKIIANSNSPFSDKIKLLINDYPHCTLIEISHFLYKHNVKITQDCDLIHVHEGRALYWALIQHIKTSIPYIITRRIDNPLKDRFFLKFGYKRASAVIGLSREIVKQIKIKCPNAALHCIPSSPVSYPIDPQVLTTMQKQTQGKFLVIQAGSLIKHKGFDTTIKAARLLLLDFPDIEFMLLGDGKEQTELELQAKGLNNVHFMGRQPCMGEWFAVASLQVHPSYNEGLGSVILEGMAASVPVIASNVGGIPDIIEHEVNGLIIEAGNSKQLADEIIRLYQDKVLRNKLITAAHKKLESFEIEQTSLVYEQLYRQILEIK